MNIFLIRHGQTTGDIENRYGGEYDDHLTSEGQNQSRTLADKLTGRGLEILYVSPRIRAQETAAILTAKLHIPVETAHEFRERNHYGVMTGMTKAEASEKFPDQVALLTDTKNTISGGEDYASFANRVLVSWEALTTAGRQRIGIVTHGGPIRVIFRELLNKGEIDLNDCSFAEIEKDGEELNVLTLDGITLKS